MEHKTLNDLVNSTNKTNEQTSHSPPVSPSASQVAINPQLELANRFNKVKGLPKKLKLVESIGMITSFIGAVSYLIVILVLIQGASDLVVETSVLAVYILINAMFGVIIGYGLALQGTIWGHAEHKELLKQYYNRQAREQKTGTMLSYWIGWWTRTIVIKSLLAIFMLTGVVMLGFSGIHDMRYFLLAVANLVMFFGFGLLGLVGGYNYVNDRFVPYVTQYLDNLLLKLDVGKSKKSDNIK